MPGRVGRSLPAAPAKTFRTGEKTAARRFQSVAEGGQGGGTRPPGHAPLGLLIIGAAEQEVVMGVKPQQETGSGLTASVNTAEVPQGGAAAAPPPVHKAHLVLRFSTRNTAASDRRFPRRLAAARWHAAAANPRRSPKKCISACLHVKTDDQERLLTQRRVPELQSQLEEYKSALCQLQSQKQRLQTEVFSKDMPPLPSVKMSVFALLVFCVMYFLTVWIR
ncbi:Filensin [Merluccius polli]|uniref:Filensin n=1 Tax=Merluccius polli TaxID=89951 RepID=A0AA47NCF5_MERPO|nr:Filensin [Merluccius polli]